MLWKPALFLLACTLGASASCNGITSVTLKGITRQLEFIAQGQSGCAFHVVGGWPEEGQNGQQVDLPAVAKTITNPLDSFYQAKNIPNANTISEYDALTRTRQLYISGLDQGLDWIIIKEYRPDVWTRVDKTKAWTDLFGEGNLYLKDPAKLDECKVFMRELYKKVEKAVQSLVNNYQVYQMDLHFGNLLGNQDLSVIQVIDLGVTELMDINEYIDEDYDVDVINKLYDYSQFPIQDTTKRRGTQFQGVCQSQMRDSGDPPYPPFKPQ